MMKKALKSSCLFAVMIALHCTHAFSMEDLWDVDSNGTILTLKLNSKLNKVKYNHANVDFLQKNILNLIDLKDESITVVGNQRAFFTASANQPKYFTLNGTSQNLTLKAFLSYSYSGEQHKISILQSLLVSPFSSSPQSCSLDDLSNPKACKIPAGDQFPNSQIYQQALTKDNGLVLVALRGLNAIDVCRYQNGSYTDCKRTGGFSSPSSVITTQDNAVNYVITQSAQIFKCAIANDLSLNCSNITPTSGVPLQCPNFSSLSSDEKKLIIPFCTGSVAVCTIEADKSIGECTTAYDQGQIPVSVVTTSDNQVIISDINAPEITICDMVDGQQFQSCQKFITSVSDSRHFGISLSRNDDTLWVTEIDDSGVSRCDISDKSNVQCAFIPIQGSNFPIGVTTD